LLVGRLLAGPERVFGFSTWRTNADLVIELARRIKKVRPDAFIVIGGPEATVASADLQYEWIDVIVMNGAEGAIGAIFRALLDGQPAEAGVWDKVWVNPKYGATRPAVPKRAGMPPMPRIDYDPIVPLFLADPLPVIPVLLNVGCPFHCSFCTNSTIYPGLEWGSTQRVVDEMMQISAIWKKSFGNGQAPPFRLTFCDATLNTQPEQFEKLCELMASVEWPHPPRVNGYIVLSRRITPRRVELAVAAGFDGFFFGLETGSRRLRSIVKKPGTIESVAHALEVLRDVGKGAIKVACGIIVGCPGETEEEFSETISFLDWAVTLGVFEQLSVNPLIRIPHAEDMGALEEAEGSPYGLDWRLPGPAGTPDVRARRAFHVIDHFSGIIPVNMGMPTRLVEKLIDRAPEPFWKRWYAVHEGQDQSPLERAADSIVGDPGDALAVAKVQRFVTDVERMLASVVADAAGRHWRLEETSEWLSDREAAVFRFVSADGARTVAILLEIRDDEKRAYARTARFNVSYLSDPGLTLDDALMNAVVKSIAAAEARPMASAVLAQSAITVAASSATSS